MASATVLVTPAVGANTVRLLTVIVLAALVVVASMVTVLLAALVTNADWLLAGGTPSDQFAPVSHFPPGVLVQLLACE